MTNTIDYKGTRWFKCDLHLHTIASECFLDKTVTSQQWVERAIEQGLNCVAVTDHNTGAMIDAIKTAALGTSLIVFPGVEITCDVSKIHLLILFDVDKTTTDIEDFLLKCGINRPDFGGREAYTSKNIFDISKIAKEEGALIIPAHIDLHSGLSTASIQNLKDLYNLDYINAVQIIHKEFIDPNLETADYSSLVGPLNEYHNTGAIPIDLATIKQWHTAVKYASLSNKAILTFSDNPYEPKSPKHGLDGIGSRYTWIKMDETPTLEGLRQAFLLPEFRIRNDFMSAAMPYKTPDLWIKSITISNSTITDDITPLRIDFTPQLTTIIGGRGSGKSSILKFIRGLFNRTVDISTLEDILLDYTDFYKRVDHHLKGVLTPDTKIEIEFVRNNVLHKLSATNITDSNNQSLTVERLDLNTSIRAIEEAVGYIDFFQYEQYSQKQFFEIAQEPNSLREIIDKSISVIKGLKGEKEIIKKLFLEKSASIRTMQQQILGKGILQTEIIDLNKSIELFQTIGIASLLTSKEKNISEQITINQFINELQSKKDTIDSLMHSMELSDIDYTTFKDTYRKELEPLSKKVIDGYSALKGELEIIKQKIDRLKTDFETMILQTAWKKGIDQNQTEFEEKKIELQTKGLDDILNFEKLLQERSSKQALLEKITTIEVRLRAEILERDKLQDEYLQKTKEITAKRESYIGSLLADDKVRVLIKPFRNKDDFINKIRDIIQKPIEFTEDIDKLIQIYYEGPNIEQQIAEVRNVFLKIRRGENTENITPDHRFVNLIKSMTDAQIDEIELLLPEDQIEIEYKPSGSTSFRSLSTASAGQKTTAILTFILSQGNIPLLLDQPEDDLDNRLVYELIVDRLKKTKEYRQIIVVTHNANIPVNGDAEYIVSMNSESQKISVLYTGTVEQKAIKKEICDVMEGGEEAFKMRSKRYNNIRD